MSAQHAHIPHYRRLHDVPVLLIRAATTSTNTAKNMPTNYVEMRLCILRFLFIFYIHFVLDFMKFEDYKNDK